MKLISIFKLLITLLVIFNINTFAQADTSNDQTGYETAELSSTDSVEAYSTTNNDDESSDEEEESTDEGTPDTSDDEYNY